MKTQMRLLRGLAVLTMVAAPGWAADVTGKWTGQKAGPDGGGGMSMSANFKQDGTKLTGTIDGPGGEQAIQDGKVEGDKISFAISFNDMKIVHAGTIKGDEITLEIKMDGGPGGGPGPIVLKRAK